MLTHDRVCTVVGDFKAGQISAVELVRALQVPKYVAKRMEQLDGIPQAALFRIHVEDFYYTTDLEAQARAEVEAPTIPQSLSISDFYAKIQKHMNFGTLSSSAVEHLQTVLGYERAPGDNEDSVAYTFLSTDLDVAKCLIDSARGFGGLLEVLTPELFKVTTTEWAVTCHIVTPPKADKYLPHGVNRAVYEYRKSQEANREYTKKLRHQMYGERKMPAPWHDPIITFEKGDGFNTADSWSFAFQSSRHAQRLVDFFRSCDLDFPKLDAHIVSENGVHTVVINDNVLPLNMVPPKSILETK